MNGARSLRMCFPKQTYKRHTSLTGTRGIGLSTTSALPLPIHSPMPSALPPRPLGLPPVSPAPPPAAEGVEGVAAAGRQEAGSLPTPTPFFRHIVFSPFLKCDTRQRPPPRVGRGRPLLEAKGLHWVSLQTMEPCQRKIKAHNIMQCPNPPSNS
jgi:hypothetical protein